MPLLNIEIDDKGFASRESMIAIRRKLLEQWEEVAEDKILAHIGKTKFERGGVAKFRAELEFSVGVPLERKGDGKQQV